jgi:hypothetical protein
MLWVATGAGWVVYAFACTLVGCTTNQCTNDEWAAPIFPDSGFGAISCCTLPVQVLVVDFLRSPVTEC